MSGHGVASGAEAEFNQEFGLSAPNSSRLNYSRGATTWATLKSAPQSTATRRSIREVLDRPSLQRHGGGATRHHLPERRPWRRGLPGDYRRAESLYSADASKRLRLVFSPRR